MKTNTISYAELAKRVGDAVLFNNHSEVDEEWYSGLIEGPHITNRLEVMDIETHAEAVKAIDESTDESEKAKLTEELDDIERASIYDLATDNIYQTYAITQYGAEYLVNHTAELVSYSEKLDLHLWHICHFGTAWSGVYVDVYEYGIDDEHEYIVGSDLYKLCIG